MSSAEVYPFYLVKPFRELVRDVSQCSDKDVCPTLTNFMLASINGHTAAELKDFLITRHGLLIRDASNFSGLTPSHFRVAAQGKTADDMLVEAIKDFCRLH